MDSFLALACDACRLDLNSVTVFQVAVSWVNMVVV